MIALRTEFCGKCVIFCDMIGRELEGRNVASTYCTQVLSSRVICHCSVPSALFITTSWGFLSPSTSTNRSVHCAACQDLSVNLPSMVIGSTALKHTYDFGVLVWVEAFGLVTPRRTSAHIRIALLIQNSELQTRTRTSISRKIFGIAMKCEP
jgi:hypothetical protein